MIKKILSILIISFLFISSANALSGSRENIEYQSCYSGSIAKGESQQFAKAYCKCFADQLDKKYTDKQLDKLVAKGYEFMISEIRPYAKNCYDKNYKSTSNSNSNSMLNLNCTTEDRSLTWNVIVSPKGSSYSMWHNWIVYNYNRGDQMITFSWSDNNKSYSAFINRVTGEFNLNVDDYPIYGNCTRSGNKKF